MGFFKKLFERKNEKITYQCNGKDLNSNDMEELLRRMNDISSQMMKNMQNSEFFDDNGDVLHNNTSTNVEYFDKCPHCAATNKAMVQNCEYCGGSLVKAYSQTIQQKVVKKNTRII